MRRESDPLMAAGYGLIAGIVTLAAVLFWLIHHFG